LLRAKAAEEHAAWWLLIAGNSEAPSLRSARAGVANGLLASFGLGIARFRWGFVQEAWESGARRAAEIASPATKSSRAI